MNTRTSSTACGVVIMLAATLTHAVGISTFNTSFSANQSLFSGGPSAGFDESGSTGGSVGISYSAVANSGTVNANVNGQVRAAYTERLNPNTQAAVNLQFNGVASSFSSSLGANANVSGFADLGCVARVPVIGTCLFTFNQSFDLLDEGLLLNPSANFTANIGVNTRASDADSAIGFGPNLDLFIGELGAELNLDIDQTIGFNPLAIDGLLSYRNRNTGVTMATPFLMGASDQTDIFTAALSPGIWDFSLLSLDLSNSFSNNIDLELRPTINYVLGEWPAPGSSPISVGLVDEAFPLNFNTLEARNLFSVEVVPVPAAVWLFGSGLFCLIGLARRKSA